MRGGGDVPASTLNSPDLHRLKHMGETKEGLKKAAQEFESFFLYQLMQSMRKTVQKCERFHGGHAEAIWEDMFDQELTRELAQAGGIGLASIIYEQMERYVSDQPPETEQQAAAAYEATMAANSAPNA
jgi:flagellar protein FlgJ